MFSAFSRHKSLSIIGSALILLLTISFNLYYITTPNVVTDDRPLTENDINQDLPGFVPNSSSTTLVPAQASPRDFIPLIITAVVLVLGFSGIIVAVKLSDKKQIKQDAQYREHLNALASAFEAYASVKGFYPKSATYSPEHYSGIHLGKEWLDYGFPADDEMKQFAQNWPIVAPEKLDKILYYVRDNGARFDLFAQIKTLPKSEAKDYNLEYELPKAWGEFNYYIASRGIVAVNPPETTQTLPPAATIPAVDPISISTATISQPPVATPAATTNESTAQAQPVVDSVASSGAIAAQPATISPTSGNPQSQVQPIGAESVASVTPSPSQPINPASINNSVGAAPITGEPNATFQPLAEPVQASVLQPIDPTQPASAIQPIQSAASLEGPRNPEEPNEPPQI